MKILTAPLGASFLLPVGHAPQVAASEREQRDLHLFELREDVVADMRSPAGDPPGAR